MNIFRCLRSIIITQEQIFFCLSISQFEAFLEDMCVFRQVVFWCVFMSLRASNLLDVVVNTDTALQFVCSCKFNAAVWIAAAGVDMMASTELPT